MNWLSLLNLIIPAATNLVLLIKNESGSTTAIISSTETATDAEIAQMQGWIKSHQTTSPAASQTPSPTATT